MTQETALEMAEALRRDDEFGTCSLGDYGDEVAEHLLGVITALRAHAEKAEETIKGLNTIHVITRTRAEKAEAEAKQLREELSHSILEATAQLVGAKADALARAEKAEAALEEAERERDQAILHDRQPYPTAEAYEAVCAARTNWQERAEKAEAALKSLVDMIDRAESKEVFDEDKYGSDMQLTIHGDWFHITMTKARALLAGKGE